MFKFVHCSPTRREEQNQMYACINKSTDAQQMFVSRMKEVFNESSPYSTGAADEEWTTASLVERACQHSGDYACCT